MQLMKICIFCHDMYTEGQCFDVVLRLRPESSPYTLSASLMDKFSKKAAAICRYV